jgi:hypothetical protein
MSQVSKHGDDTIYTQWKEQDAPEIDIFLLNRSVPFNYYFESMNIRTLIEHSSGKIADRLKTTIYIFKENPTVNIFQILSEHQEVLFQKGLSSSGKIACQKGGCK